MTGKRTLLLATMAIAMAAYLAPSAQAQLLHEKNAKGEHIALSNTAEITATSENLLITSSIGSMWCLQITMHVKGTFNGAASSWGSISATTTTACSHSMVFQTGGKLTVSGGGVGEASGIGFTVEGLCTFSGTIPFSYETKADVLTVTGKEQLSSPFCGKASVSGSFSLETKDGTPVYIT